MRRIIQALVVIAFAVLAGRAANAACVRVDQARAGGAVLVNDCAWDMNIAYGVTPGGDWAPGDGNLVRLLVAGNSRQRLWSDSNRPYNGRYSIKVFSCVAPATLIYPTGGKPTCQVSYADAG